MLIVAVYYCFIVCSNRLLKRYANVMKMSLYTRAIHFKYSNELIVIMFNEKMKIT